MHSIFLLVFYIEQIIFFDGMKESRINLTLGFTGAMPCHYLLIAAGIGMVILKGPVIFHLSKCCVLGRTRCIRKAMPFLHVGFRFSYQAFTSWLRFRDFNLLIDFAPARNHESLLPGYVQCSAIFERKKCDSIVRVRCMKTEDISQCKVSAS